MAKQFGFASAFKASLEARLRKQNQEHGLPLSTLQLKFAIERLLGRLFLHAGPPWLLKGGFAMDLRFRPRARTTKDIDLSIPLVSDVAGPLSAAMRDQLQAAADADLGDFLSFRIGKPKKEITNAPKGGGRYPCEAILVGKTYAAFHIDIGVGDAVVGEPERLIGDDILEFAGIEPVSVLAIPKPQQFAEKVHAYTFPWSGRLNTRTKDLVDLVLLLERGHIEAARIRDALAMTFSNRATHPLPVALAPPPNSWKDDFMAMATEANLSTTNYLEAFRLLENYWIDNALSKG
jgi:hypothetical protein